MKINIILLLLLTCVSIFSCNDIHQRCETTEDCLNYFNCEEGFCVHKGLFPMTFLEILVIIFLSSMSIVATAAGVGGGAIYSAILMFVENFSAMEAFPVSNFVILFCTLITFYIGVISKAKNTEQRFVDYDVVAVFVPTMLLGTKLGVLLNKILPSLLLNILLILALAYSCYKSYKNAIKQKKLEERKVSLPSLNQRPSFEYVVDENMFTGYSDIMSPMIDMKEIQTNQKRKNTAKGMITCKDELNADTLKNNNKNIWSTLFEGKDAPIRMDRIKGLLLLEGVMIIDQLIEGSDKIPSFLGIHKCSTAYWVVFTAYILFCTWYAKYTYDKIKEENRSRTLNASENNNTEFKLTSAESEEKMNKILFICLIAGIISGMLGVGGGIVMAPLMLELGMHPRTTASTSNFLLIITSSAGTILFTLSGQLMLSFAVALAIPCTLASLFGSRYITDYVAKTNKNSTLVYLLFYVMLFSLIILPINGIKRAIYDMRNGEDIFGVRNYCV